MREILFRGKDKELGIWRLGSLHVDSLYEKTRYYINPRISVDNPVYIEVDEDSIGQLTDSKTVAGEKIFEGMTVHQIGTVTGDDTDFTGEVEMLEGCWVITNHKDNAIPLWSETAENRIISHN
jgi:hypothetical protein